MKLPIEEIIIFGDSLTDRGAMSLNKHMAKFAQLRKHHSPLGRFTNGYVWSDYFLTMIINALIIKNARVTAPTFKKTQMGFNINFKHDTAEELVKLSKHNYMLDSADKGDAILNGDRYKNPAWYPSLVETNEKIASAIIDGDTRFRNRFTLQSPSQVYYEGNRLARIFAIGGLTSHNYMWQFCLSFKRSIIRFLLSNLNQMREALKQDDKTKEVTLSHKSKTLVIEWSGANDLITVNSKPSMSAVDLAINARVKNIMDLMKQGYCHFVWFNLPDISLTPRFAEYSPEDQKKAQACSLDFKQKLEKACKQIRQRFPYCQLDIYDVHTFFSDRYRYPEKYGFDPNKRNIPFTSSPFDKNRKGDGYMFWDKIHPSSDVHALLGEDFYKWIQARYYFANPKQESLQTQKGDVSSAVLLGVFRKAYKNALERDRNGFFGYLRRSRIDYLNSNLSQIIFHALYEKGGRTLDVLKSLNWLNRKGNLNLNITALKEAYEQATLSNLSQKSLKMR